MSFSICQSGSEWHVIFLTWRMWHKMIMLMGWVCVSELRPPIRLFISQVIYEHGEPWWNDIDRGKLLSFVKILPAESSSSKSGGTGWWKWWLWPSKYLCSYLVIFTCCKILWHGADGFTSSPKEGMLQTFYYPWLGLNHKLWVQSQAH
jgi:hypothetical protein